jgi:hypothetical protein
VSEHDFQLEVIQILTDLRTKMNSLVGADGNNGRMSALESEVDRLKEQRSRNRGVFDAISAAWAVVGAVGVVVVEWLRHK